MKLPRLTRRRFIGTLGCAALATYAYAWRIEPHWVEEVERDLPIANLPSALVGKRLVQISDLHIGQKVNDEFIAGAIGRACSLGDLLVITGDFMTAKEDEELDHVSRVLESSLRHPPLGTYAIFGNHDYGHTFHNSAVADRLAGRVRDLGIHLLRDEIADVGGLQLAGLDDVWSTQFNPEKVTGALDPKRASLVLCHNPDGADFPGWNGYRGWILSGHTHGGQCKPPFLDPPLLPVINRRYIAGEIALKDGRRIYINRALGHLKRVRFNVRPEITIFTLRADQLAAVGPA
jgi:predicted MPP superfamily phosphohydrolase